jgi:hypothetical protein
MLVHPSCSSPFVFGLLTPNLDATFARPNISYVNDGEVKTKIIVVTMEAKSYHTVEDLPAAQPSEGRSVSSSESCAAPEEALPPPRRRTTPTEGAHISAPRQSPRPARRTRMVNRRPDVAAAISLPTPARRSAPRRRLEDFPPPSSRLKRRRITYGEDGEG